MSDHTYRLCLMASMANASPSRTGLRSIPKEPRRHGAGMAVASFIAGLVLFGMLVLAFGVPGHG